MRLLKLATGSLTADIVWRDYYCEVLALIRDKYKCSEEQARLASHDLYIVARRRQTFERWDGRCNAATWLAHLIRSQYSKLCRRLKHESVLVEYTVSQANDEDTAEASSLQSRLTEELSAKNQKIFAMLRSEMCQRQIAQEMRIHRIEVAERIKHIREVAGIFLGERV